MKLNISSQFQAVILRKIQSGAVINVQLVNHETKKKISGQRIGTLDNGEITVDVYLKS